MSAISRDEVVHTAITKATRLLPEERQFDLKRMEEAAKNAKRLARQADQALRALIGDRSSRTDRNGPRRPEHT